MTTITTPAVLSSAVTTNKPSRRAMLIGLASVPFVTSAASAFTVSENAEWIALLADERRLLESFNQACVAHSISEERYFAMKPEPPKAMIYPTSTADGVIYFDAEKYNADLNAGRAAYKEACTHAQEASRYNQTEAASATARQDHEDALERIWAYPSTDPAIISEKLKLAVREYDDENGHVAMILGSISAKQEG